MNTAKRNVVLLAICQATLMIGQSLMLTAAPWVGLALTGDKTLATLPIGVQFGVTLLTVMPAAFLMKHIGRRPGFVIGAVFGVIGSILAAYGIWHGQFVLFCLGLGLNGVFNGFGTYYRFAAADAAGPDYRSTAISYVLAGGVVAAFVGPNLANWTADLATAKFSGSYLSLAAVYLIALVALMFVDIPPPTSEERRGRGRPMWEIARQPAFMVAVIAAMFGYGIMSLIMTSTPLTLHDHNYSFGETAFIIQWHLVAMFAPSFVTGRLIKRFGVSKIILLGTIFYVGCVLLNLLSTDFWAVWLALVLLGLGWNFLFVGGTTLLTDTYTPEERAKTQALNDFLVLGVVTATAFSSGPLHYKLGWQALNMSVVPLIVAIVIAVAWLRRTGSTAKTS
ncbi:MAG: MFS transporter [Gammaproteobacteria bacterium]|nr:MFS transporter [Gammaproteobacteria bacterium]